jgi:hypothetical protein
LIWARTSSIAFASTRSATALRAASRAAASSNTGAANGNLGSAPIRARSAATSASSAGATPPPRSTMDSVSSTSSNLCQPALPVITEAVWLSLASVGRAVLLWLVAAAVAGAVMGWLGNRIRSSSWPAGAVAAGLLGGQAAALARVSGIS